MRYLSAEAILVLHSEVVDATSGSHGVRDVGLLAAIVDKPKASFGGNDLYPGVFMKAAVYLESVVNYHVFVDGNKRTGLTACARFLYQNGYTLTGTNTEIEQFVLSAVVEKIELEVIATWLKSHTVKSRTAKPRGKKKR